MNGKCFLTLKNVKLCTWVITILRLIMLWMGVYCNVSVRKTLGVIVRDDSKWEKQCSETVKKLIEY